jgi:hypothetical protein
MFAGNFHSPELSEVQAIVTLRHPDNIVANITTVVSFVRLSVTGRREGVHFHRDKWVGFLIIGMLLGR